MKRFWKSAAADPVETGWAINLDARPVRTPSRAELVVPTEALAAAIVDEWNAVEGTIDPRAMPMTGLANAAIDRIEPAPIAFADGLARYAQADLACYRTETPLGLADRQSIEWDRLLAWARRRFDVDFAVTTGLTHVEQPQATVERLRHAVSVLRPFQLAGLSPLVTAGGSLVAGLGVLEGAFTPDQAWAAVTVEERWQFEQWGSDAEAEAALENRRQDFVAGARFLSLLD
jgi:chaperone required for assembly of F1-ATPase